MGKRSRKRDVSWLLAPYPPAGRCSGEALLWWAALRQAARDLRYEHESLALDALEFLRVTGVWLAERLFEIDGDEFKREVTRLVLLRARVLGRMLVIPPLSRDDIEESVSST